MNGQGTLKILYSRWETCEGPDELAVNTKATYTCKGEFDDVVETVSMTHVNAAGAEVSSEGKIRIEVQ